jgi:glucosamine--fructose-6-phosphate aminotransferase (isomerizing)
MADTSALRKAIASQPDVVRDVLASGHEAFARAGAALRGADRVLIAGTGSSSHAAVVGEHLLRSVNVDAYATTSFDLAVYPRPLRPSDALIVISHTGGTQYGARAIAMAKEAGALVIGVTRDESAMHGDDIRVSTGPTERSDTYTVSYVASLAALAAIAAETGRAGALGVDALEGALSRLPDMIAGALEMSAHVDAVSIAADDRGRILMLGAGPNAVTAREGALKIKESSYLTVEGFEVETAIHGGFAALEAGDLAVVLIADGPAVARLKDAARLLKHIGTRIWVVADERIAVDFMSGDCHDLAEWVTPVPSVLEPLSPALLVVPLQMFAARIAELRGTNPDNFKFDVPAFKEAYGSVKL